MISFDQIKSTITNVNYTDLPIIALFIYHIIEFIIALIVRKTKLHRSLMFAYCIFFYVYGDTIQYYCKSNLKYLRFSKDYFDDQHIFLFIFFQFPTILSGIVLVISLAYDYIKFFKGQKSDKTIVKQNEAKTKND